MQFIYRTILNALIFYFIVNLFAPGIVIASGNNLGLNLLSGVLFGMLLAAVPFVLGFFKLPNSTAAEILLSLVFIFMFFFLLSIGFAGLGTVKPTYISLGAGVTFNFPTVMQTVVGATAVAALAVVGMENLRKRL
jgi:hypothetical protein